MYYLIETRPTGRKRISGLGKRTKYEAERDRAKLAERVTIEVKKFANSSEASAYIQSANDGLPLVVGGAPYYEQNRLKPLDDSLLAETNMTHRTLQINQQQTELLRAALTDRIDLLCSPTSADRDARGAEAADAEVAECQGLLAALQAASTTRLIAGTYN